MARMDNVKRGPVKKGTFGRLVRYLFKYYKWRLIVVLVCIAVSGLSGVIASVFLQGLIDRAIVPGLTDGLDSVWGELVRIIGTMIAVYAAGVISSLIYTQIMASVTQGTLKHLRDDMFSRMETLPVSFFDRNSTGSIMSTYTNDTDAIRQMIGQSIPSVYQTFLSIAAIAVSMLRFSIWMTMGVALFIFLMTRVTRTFGGRSARGMVDQQKSLAAEEGFIQEIMNGQKVVQVFNHEELAKADFRKLNQKLFEDGNRANRAGFMLMPILANIGNIMYIALAILGGILIAVHAPNVYLFGVNTVTVGVIVSFLTMTRQLSQSVGQASMQVSMIALGLAGVSRVFDLIDQEPEQDEGYVELVNAEYVDKSGRVLDDEEIAGIRKTIDEENGITRQAAGEAGILAAATAVAEAAGVAGAAGATASIGADGAAGAAAEEAGVAGTAGAAASIGADGAAGAEAESAGVAGAAGATASIGAEAAGVRDEDPVATAGIITEQSVLPDGIKIRETSRNTEHWAWKHPHQDGTLTYTPLRGDVRLFHVDFGYVPEKLVLHDISLYARPGQKIAFVGATGAGKTTITNLINRFYDIPDGKIRYDGINIGKIKKPNLRRSLGVVLQDVNLFTGTVMDNIRYGRLDATDEECKAAAKLANADDFITRLPDGYNTFLTNNGAQLSQGQRQLISIARAAVADPPVMILDEATSSIDTRTEALVQQGMDNLMKGRTVFVIAHRLSTVRNSDAIMVLDHGRIIERGSHDELIARKGTYYQLYTGAFELE